MTLKELQLQKIWCKRLSAMAGVDINKFKANAPEDIYSEFDKYRFVNIWYNSKPDFCMNKSYRDDPVISENHKMLVSFFTPHDFTNEQIFELMQGETWSPEGEARSLIEAVGLRHTSMSVGDCIDEPDLLCFYEVGEVGFNTYYYEEYAEEHPHGGRE